MSNLTKGVIEDVSDLEGDGFIVWATWTKDKDDNSIFTNNYADGFYENVFGDGGTKVIRTQGVWKYSPPKYWHRGIYTFAAVLPASTFNATYSDYTPAELTNPYGTYTGGVVTNEDNTLSYNPSVITLHLGEEGYDLSAEQDDIMVAYYNVDNRSENAPQTTNGVSLNFKHQMSLVTIKGASINPNTDGIQIDEITVYGNSAKTYGDMVFSYDGSTVSADFDVTGTTDENNVYKTFTEPSKTDDTKYDWQLVRPTDDGTPVYDVLVPELIVFPESCTFTIVVKYTESGISKTRIGTLTSSWEAGKKYTYNFNIATDITFSVDVSEWTASRVNDEDIDIV